MIGLRMIVKGIFLAFVCRAVIKRLVSSYTLKAPSPHTRWAEIAAIGHMILDN